jgi:hypothetical protein
MTIVVPEARAWIRTLPCLLGHVHECLGTVRCCHVSHGIHHDDPENMWPGCDLAHMVHHDLGTRLFNERFGITLEEIARALWRAHAQGSDFLEPDIEDLYPQPRAAQ